MWILATRWPYFQLQNGGNNNCHMVSGRIFKNINAIEKHYSKSKTRGRSLLLLSQEFAFFPLQSNVIYGKWRQETNLCQEHNSQSLARWCISFQLNRWDNPPGASLERAWCFQNLDGCSSKSIPPTVWRRGFQSSQRPQGRTQNIKQPSGLVSSHGRHHWGPAPASSLSTGQRWGRIKNINSSSFKLIGLFRPIILLF